MTVQDRMAVSFGDLAQWWLVGTIRALLEGLLLAVGTDLLLEIAAKAAAVGYGIAVCSGYGFAIL